jgi:hypothetical protein
VLVVLGEGDGTLEGRIEWRDRNGTWAGDRTFPARTSDCAELTRAVGFALAVQINLLATEREEAPAGASHQATQGAPEAAPPPAPSSSKAGELENHDESNERVTAERSPWVFGVGAGATLAVGMSPGVMGLVGVFGSAARGRLSLELGAELSTQSVKYREDGAGYSQRTLLGSAAACVTESVFDLCAVAKAGTLSVAGRDIDEPASPTGKAFQIGVRVGVRERLGHGLFIAERVEGLANLTRWNVTLDQIPVWTAPLFAATLGLNAGTDF